MSSPPVRRWSDGLMMAAHRTMRLRMTRGAFPPSSFSGRKEACYESTCGDRAWRYRTCSGDHRALGYSRGAAVRAWRDLRAGGVDRGERPRAFPGAPLHLTHDASSLAYRHANGATARGDYP